MVASVLVGGGGDGLSPASSSSKSHKTHSKTKKKKSGTPVSMAVVALTPEAFSYPPVAVVQSQPVLSVALPPSSLQPPPLTVPEPDWEDSSDTPDLPFLSSLQPVGGSLSSYSSPLSLSLSLSLPQASLLALLKVSSLHWNVVSFFTYHNICITQKDL